MIAAIEAKSQVGPFGGNNFNNRTEEAMGTALDLWTAFRGGAFNGGRQPFLGYFFMLEDCEASNRPVRVKESHFKVFPESLTTQNEGKRQANYRCQQTRRNANGQAGDDQHIEQDGIMMTSEIKNTLLCGICMLSASGICFIPSGIQLCHSLWHKFHGAITI
jgi:hypothetical protein